MNPITLLETQRHFYQSGLTRQIDWRKVALRRLLKELIALEDDILLALKSDIGKSSSEGRLTETNIVHHEGKFLLRQLAKYARGRRFPLEAAYFPAYGRILPEPYGQVLIISPWNYPFQLAMLPLLGAIAAGNTVILKPSRATPTISHLLQQLISTALPEKWATVITDTDGDELLDLDVDYIFFTGSSKTGSQIAASAAKRLIPTTLELGGKSPVIVSDSADIAVAARRIIFGKLMNAGQTCVAPDYVLVQRRVADELACALAREAKRQLPDDNEWPHIVKDSGLHRLQEMLSDAPIYAGGQWHQRQLEPTILYPATADCAAMQEEIFGPILPLLPYDKLTEAVSFVNAGAKPLAAYFFSQRQKELEYLAQYISSGGACFNDTLMHVASSRLPFGGVGESGQGQYHGRASLEVFSHEKSIFVQEPSFDLPLRYPPYGLIQRWLIKTLL